MIATVAAEGRPLRAVSLGAAGGQEAYSLAMLLAETTGADAFEVDAFDVDPDALDVAREATYPERALAPVSRKARARYFREVEPGAWQVTSALRRRVRIARLNILRDTLPRRYDVALCRNVLIYVEGQAKDKLLEKAHAALAPHGILVLGQSEIVLGAASRRYRALSTRYRVYAKVSA